MIYTFGTFAHTSLDNGGSPIAAGATGDTLTFNVRSLADAAKFGTASTGAGTAFYIWWENEILKVTDGGAGSLSWTTTRGQFGTTASAHADGTAIRETVPGAVFAAFQQGGAFSGEVAATDLNVTGVTGAASAFRLMGANPSGAPTTGTFVANDVALDLTNHEFWLCTAGGTPGTWVAMGGGGGGGGSLTTASAQLSANVSMATANTYYDGPSVSLTAGTWLVMASVVVGDASSAVHVTAKLWDGTTVSVSSQQTGGSANFYADPTILAFVTPGSTTTYKISAAAHVATAVMYAAAPNNGAGNNASYILAVKIG